MANLRALFKSESALVLDAGPASQSAAHSAPDFRDTFRSAVDLRFSRALGDNVFALQFGSDGADPTIQSYVLQGYRWDSNQYGVGATVTWSIASVNYGSLSSIFSGYNSFDNSLPLSYAGLVSQAFAVWAAAANITFTQVTDPSSLAGDASNLPNIRFGIDFIDGSPFGSDTLAETRSWYWVEAPLNELRTSQIRIDPDTLNNSSQMLSVLIHEIGHALGLGHGTTPNEIMYFQTNSLNLDGILDPQDIAGIRTLYGGGAQAGDAGNTFATAQLTTLSFAGAGSVGSGGDTDDFYKFTPSRNGTLVATLYGLSADLDLALYNAGQTQLAISLLGGAAIERFQVNLVAGQTYYIRVDPYLTAFSNYSLQLGFLTDIADTLTLAAATLNVHARAGNDNITGSAGADRIYGDAGLDNLRGGVGNDSLIGGAGNDILNGGSGADSLYGDAGHDNLTGGAGADKFLFNATPNATNSDVVTDFTHASDKIQLQNSVFTALTTTGTLATAAFWSNGTGAAHDASDRIIYNASNGGLYYDRDGTGAIARVLIATLDAGLTVTNTDFVVI